MRAAAVRDALRARLRPAAWGPIPVFLALALGLRLLLGGALPPPQPRVLLTGAAFLLGTYLLGPLPWQWDGRRSGTPSLLRGCLQALAWNAGWIGAVGLAVWTADRLAPGPAQLPPFLLQLASRAGLSPWLLQGALMLPMAFLAGWLVAAKEAAEAAREEARRSRAELELAARQAQLQALQAQLDPHVLYNALGGLSELARRDPAATERALLELADLYRSLTDLGRRGRIALGEERTLLARQLGLEALRLGDRLRVRWAWPADLDAVLLPPLLVQPLVENAIKHGIAPAEAGGELHLAAGRSAGGGLQVEVANTGCPLEDGWREGTGLANVATRLALLGGGGRLALRQDGPWTRAVLELPAAVLA